MNNLTFISRHDYYFTPGRERYFAGRWPFASMVIEKIKTLEGVEREIGRASCRERVSFGV